MRELHSDLVAKWEVIDVVKGADKPALPHCHQGQRVGVARVGLVGVDEVGVSYQAPG